MGSDETRTNGGQRGSDETGNVVRIPRDWFGPKDDLVPFGPAAWSGEAESTAEARSESARRAEAPLDADTFWGEDADSLHDVFDERPAAARRSSVFTRRGTLLPAALVLLMASAGLTTWLLGSPQRRAPRPHVASVKNEVPAMASRLRQKLVARAHSARASLRSPPRSLHRRSVSVRAVRTTAVVYRPTEVISSPTSTATPVPASTNATAVSSSASGSSAATSASTSHESQPAFGANGALGPMSSSAG